jgi:hypothetical protein
MSTVAKAMPWLVMNATKSLTSRDACADLNPTYSHRVDDPGAGNRLPCRLCATRTCVLNLNRCDITFGFTFSNGERLPIEIHRLNLPPVLCGDGYPAANCADSYNFCAVPDSGQDAIVYGALALVLSCLLQGRLSALWVFIAGASLGMHSSICEYDSSVLCKLAVCAGVAALQDFKPPWVRTHRRADAGASLTLPIAKAVSGIWGMFTQVGCCNC